MSDFFSKKSSKSQPYTLFWTKTILTKIILDLKTLSFKIFLKMFLRCSEARISLKIALFGKLSKDKVEINEREVNSLKNIFNILFRGLELKKIGREGKKLVGEMVELETVKRELGRLTKSGLSFLTLEL